MSYRPSEQSIEQPARELIEGVNNFCEAVDARIEANDWADSYIDELVLLTTELANLKLKLLRLVRKTW